jgi:DNA-binding transcriptional LysR family regulator
MNPNHLDLVSLRLFVAVAEHGSMSAGANVSHLSVGAVSKRIGDLESIAGTALFERMSTGVRVTAAGNAMLSHARTVLQAVQRLALDIHDHVEGVAGQVRVAANPSAVLQGLAGHLQVFLKAHPNVKFELEERLSADVVRAVQERRAEIGLFADNVPHDGLEVHAYDADQLVLLSSTSHPLARRGSLHLVEALEHDFVGQVDSVALNSVMSMTANHHGVPLKLRCLMRGYDGIVRMVAAGFGISVVPVSATTRHAQAAEVAIIELKDPWAQRRLLVGVREGQPLGPAARALLEQLLHPDRGLEEFR